MTKDTKLVSSKLKNWKTYLNEYELPDWDNIPSIGLYMEQVIALLKQYLDYLPPDIKEEQFITAATINNYVRMNIIPEPIKKKYYRIHIAYLIIVLTMKKGIAISLIQKLVPADMSEDEIRIFYEKYSSLHKKACVYFTQEVAKAGSPILNNGESGQIEVTTSEELVALSSIISGFAHLLSEKLLLLE